MITAIEVSGFKAFSRRERLELTPITLLFGPNSGGKSSFIHAIHYARELLLRQNVDAYFTESGGEQVELGGFETFAHRQIFDTGKENLNDISIGFELDLGETDLPTFSDDLGADVESLLSAIKTAFVRWHIAPNFDHTGEKCLGYNAYSLDIEINGNQVGYWNAGMEYGEEEEGNITLSLEELAGKDSKIIDDDSDLSWLSNAWESESIARAGVALAYSVNAIPHNWNSALELGFSSAESDEDEVLQGRTAIVEIISRLFVGIPKLVKEQLEGLKYIGPIRDIPPRYQQPPTPVGLSTWSNGLAAWDALESDPSLAKEVSMWLGDQDRLDAEYRLEVVDSFETAPHLIRQKIREIEEDPGRSVDDFFNDGSDSWAYALHGRKRRQVFLRDAGGKLFHPKDVGIGYSQLVPVITAALMPSPMSTGPRLILTEQPELHIHPRLQAQLGDLLIESALNPEQPRCLILETHSEHMVLRLLRRIRETAEGELPAGIHQIKPSDLGVYYIQRSGGCASIQRLRVDEEGEFIDRWPNGFFDERMKELF